MKNNTLDAAFDALIRYLSKYKSEEIKILLQRLVKEKLNIDISITNYNDDKQHTFKKVYSVANKYSNSKLEFTCVPFGANTPNAWNKEQKRCYRCSDYYYEKNLMLKNEDGLFHSECASVEELEQVVYNIKIDRYKQAILELIEEKKNNSGNKSEDNQPDFTEV
jgi:hypothetical protein